MELVKTMKNLIAMIFLTSTTYAYAGLDCSEGNLSNLSEQDLARCTKIEEVKRNQRDGRASAQAANQANASAACAQLEKQAQAKMEYNGTYQAEGTEALSKCMKLSRGNFRKLYKNGQKAQSFNWRDAIASSESCTSAAVKACGEAKEPSTPQVEFDKALNTCIEATKPQAAKCDAAAYIISTEKDYDNGEDNKPDTYKDAASGINCTSKGIETLDYNPCVKFAQNASLMDVAQQAIHKGQELYYADKAMSAQADVAKSDNTATAALEALKTGVKSQKEMMEQRAALDTGKLAALASMYMDMPDMSTLKSKCGAYRLPDELSGTANACEQTLSVQPGFGFLMNGMAKEKMKAKLVKVGIDVGSDAVMAGLLAKREGDLNKAIANVEAFKPIDPLAPQQDNLQTTYCQQNPGDAKCLTGGLERTFDMMNDNVITFGEGGTGASFNANNPFSDSTNTNSNAVSPNTKNSITGVGSTIAAAQQGSGLADPIAAGTITKGGAAPGGGGGGGGGGGSLGGGGGGAPGGQGNPGGVSAAIGGKAPAYNGGSGFSIVGNGSGLRNNKGKDAKEDNPFGKLFGKNTNANGALNFRDPASQKVGDKKDNIFDMISKRYTTVSGEKRLIEYESAK